jgi:uncharacterized SAM-binding protein YcdF (DUF218 family)
LSAADIFWFLFSSSGVIVLLIAGVSWLFTRPTSRAARVFLLVVAGCYALASIYPVPHAVERLIGTGYHQLNAEDVPPGRTVVVLLGSGTYTRLGWNDTRKSVLDPIGLERTLEAARVFQMIQPTFLISSGGVIEPEQPGDAAGETMKDTLVSLGVPPDRIIVEHQSTNTRDEAVIVARMLPELDVQHVVIVTSMIHMRRALGMFRAVGIEAIPAVARQREFSGAMLYVLPTETGLRLSALAVHELAGLVFYKLKGWYK